MLTQDILFIDVTELYSSYFNTPFIKNCIRQRPLSFHYLKYLNTTSTTLQYNLLCIA